MVKSGTVWPTWTGVVASVMTSRSRDSLVVVVWFVGAPHSRPAEDAFAARRRRRAKDRSDYASGGDGPRGDGGSGAPPLHGHLLEAPGGRFHPGRCARAILPP